MSNSIINKMISAREKKIKNAKEKTISKMREDSIEVFLYKWLVQAQITYPRLEGAISKMTYFDDAFSVIRSVLNTIDAKANVELLWVDSEDAEVFILDGIKITWSPEVGVSRNQQILVVDAQYLLAKELGIE